ncbi:hypothetical protein BJX70DRAFT_291473 [Aspergillus crustosus]
MMLPMDIYGGQKVVAELRRPFCKRGYGLGNIIYIRSLVSQAQSNCLVFAILIMSPVNMIRTLVSESALIFDERRTSLTAQLQDIQTVNYHDAVCLSLKSKQLHARTLPHLYTRGITRKQFSILFWAAYSGQGITAGRCLSLGADLNTYSALIIAARDGNASFNRVLLYGHDVDVELRSRRK